MSRFFRPLWKFNRPTLWLIGLFTLTRLHIWFNRPLVFSEIIYSYMPYAHLWASGVKPYLEQWYEYPPVTIPLFYLPHLIDRQTFGQFLHLNYLEAYRLLMMIIDLGVFALVWRSLIKFGVKAPARWLALTYFCLATAKANHFLYDTMDWSFAAALVISVAPSPWSIVAPQQHRWSEFLAAGQVWLGYWLGVGLKLLNGPLGLPLALLGRTRWRPQWLSLIATGVLVWGLPLWLYRSSLSVMLVFHQQRGLQVDSWAATVVRVFDSWTHSEKIIEIYKNYEITGPLSTLALQILNLIFPLSLFIFIAWTSYQAWKLAPRLKDHPTFRLSITLGLVLLLMLTSKVLSRPFVLWHIPLVAMLPLTSWRDQLRFFLPSLLLIAVTLTAIPDFLLGPLSTATWVGVIRSLAFLWLFGNWLGWHQSRFSQSTS